MKKTLLIPVIAALFAYAGTVGAQTATPSLLVQLQSAGVASTINPGASNVTLANIYLDATRSSDGIRLTNLPITLTTGNGGVASNLRSCRLANSTSTNSPLNTGNNAISNLSTGSNLFTFDNPLVIPQGTSMNLYLICNIDPSLAGGGTYQFSVNTSNVSAVAASTGLPAIVGTIVGGSAGVPTVPVPGIPNTGFGGNSTTNILLILGAIMLGTVGVVYARKTV